MKQLTHYNSKFSKIQFPVTLVCDNVSNAVNIGSLLRTADAFGIEKVIFCGTGISMNRKVLRTSRATEKIVDYEIKENVSEIVKLLKNKGFLIIALEITQDSQPIHSIDFSNENPIALVVGDENFGISEDILKFSNTIVHIDMFGQNSSMNVVQASNIALYEITKQLR